MNGWTVWRMARIAAGVICLGLGVAGLFLPFLQGILLLMIGLTLLSRDSQYAHRLLTWLRARVHGHATPAAAEARKGVDDAG